MLCRGYSWGMEASSGVGSCYLMKETPSSLDSGFVFVNVVSEIRGGRLALPESNVVFKEHLVSISN